LKDLGVDSSIILQWIPKKYDVKTMSEFFLLPSQKRLSASQEGLQSTKFFMCKI
jgi:hypothetical protein